MTALHTRMKSMADAFARTLSLSKKEARQQMIDIAHPIGSYFYTEDDEHPSVTFPNTVWEYLGGGVTLVAADGSTYLVGSEGGSDTVTLAVANLPAHTHTQKSCDTQGSHTHTQKTCDTQGAHTHGRGTMEITGYASQVNSPFSSNSTSWNPTGVFSDSSSVKSSNTSFNTAEGSGADSSDSIVKLYFRASNNWSGATDSKGGHSHTITLNNNGGHSHTVVLNDTGSGTSFSVKNKYRACYIYRRTG